MRIIRIASIEGFVDFEKESSYYKLLEYDQASEK